MTNVIELLKTAKIADNDFQAAAIANGLKLADLKTDEERLARARLYRDWRCSQIFGKATGPCYEKAIAGEAVPVVSMFEEVEIQVCPHCGGIDKSTHICPDFLEPAPRPADNLSGG